MNKIVDAIDSIRVIKPTLNSKTLGRTKSHREIYLLLRKFVMSAILNA